MVCRVNINSDHEKNVGRDNATGSISPPPFLSLCATKWVGMKKNSRPLSSLWAERATVSTDVLGSTAI
jgi:hypothetical protein